MSSPRNDLVKNYRVHPTHWLISKQVTGTKFEEPDEKKNPQRRGGHQVKGMKEVDPETAKRMEAVREHQSNCPRLPWADEIRTMAAQPRGFASLSTVSCAEGIAGFPSGSVVGFAALDDGTVVEGPRRDGAMAAAAGRGGGFAPQRRGMRRRRVADLDATRRGRDHAWGRAPGAGGGGRVRLLLLLLVGREREGRMDLPRGHDRDPRARRRVLVRRPRR